MNLDISFGHPDRILSPNASVPLTSRGAKAHNLKRTAEKTKTRELAKLKALVMVSLLPQQAFQPRYLDVTWFYKGVRPDIDNVVARLKPLIDGCALAFRMNDRDLELGRVRRVHTLGEQAGTVVLHFSTEEACSAQTATHATQQSLPCTDAHQKLFNTNGN